MRLFHPARKAGPALALLLCSAIWGVVSAAVAQDASTAAIRGTVSDTSGGRVTSAQVILVNVDTGVLRSATSNGDGSFSFELLPPGNYSVRVLAPRMLSEVRNAIHVEVGGAAQVDFNLTIAGVTEELTVSSAPSQIETESSQVSSVIEENAIANLPLNGRRYTDFALLTPGVTTDPRGLTSSSYGDLAYGGMRGFQSSYLVDGADNNNSFFGQARGRYRAPYQFSNEVVQEFRVSSNSYGAEMGRAGGAVVNVITKSGSNRLHGSGFFYIRDSRFNATQAFMDFKPADRQEQFGATIGGPITRNRAFFYAGFDQHIFHVPAVVRFADGTSLVTPNPGNYPIVPPDYEASDKPAVFAAANQLSSLAGQFRSELLGNTGFAKVDVALSSREYLTARVNTSRYYGKNNVFFDPASPITNYSITDNGEEDVATETGTISLTSAFSSRTTSHVRVQFSNDLQRSTPNSTGVLTEIYNFIDGFGQSSILPRETREHKFHIAETVSLEGGRHSWKFGGDTVLTTIYNYFPSLFDGEYIFGNIRVDPFTYKPETYGTKFTPLRAYAHGVPLYYMQNFGNSVSHPDTNEYAAFAQDTVRVTSHLALNLGVRYDLQTFTTKGLVSNPLWPASGKVPLDTNNVAPRAGFAYSLGEERPIVVRGGYGLFYTRIPQIYTSAIATDNGITSSHLFLDNTNFYNRLLFPSYPNPLINCGAGAKVCLPSTELAGNLTSDISAFAPNFQTPKVHQASLSVEKEIARRLAIGVAYLYVHGQDLIRARDVNLPQPITVTYPVFDSSGNTFLGSYDTVDSFSTWQLTRSITCAFPPCINPLVRPIPKLAAINEFDSAASSDYHGVTLSVHRRMTQGFYFRLGYTFAHAIDDGADALVAGRPSLGQNSYSPNSERASSVTDQRHRFVFSWIAEPKPFGRGSELLGHLFNNWKVSSTTTVGSGRPFEAKVFGDPNQDGDASNDRLPGLGRNALVGPDYATTDARLSRDIHLGDHLKLVLLVETFNLMNRTNYRVTITDDGFQNTAGTFVQYDQHVGRSYYPAQYRYPATLSKATDAYAPRQVQFSVRFVY